MSVLWNDELSPDSGPYFTDGSPAMLALESMVDRVGLANVLYALSIIAQHKADHVEENWQDRAVARVWQLEARRLHRTARQVETD